MNSITKSRYGNLKSSSSVETVSKYLMMSHSEIKSSPLRTYLRYLWNKQTIVQFENQIQLNSALSDLVEQSYNFRPKIFRRYFCDKMSFSERFASLCNHYNLLLKKNLKSLSVAFGPNAKVITEFIGKNGTQFQLKWEALDLNELEGESRLTLYYKDLALYSVSFTFLYINEKSYLGVGCFQGPKGANAASLVKEATKELFHNRPRDLMMTLLRGLSDYFDCQALLIVNNKCRLCSYGKNRNKMISSDYNLIATECSGTPFDDRFYVLTNQRVVFKNLDKVPSKKRSEERSSLELINFILQSIYSRLAHIDA